MLTFEWGIFFENIFTYIIWTSGILYINVYSSSFMTLDKQKNSNDKLWQYHLKDYPMLQGKPMKRELLFHFSYCVGKKIKKLVDYKPLRLKYMIK